MPKKKLFRRSKRMAYTNFKVRTLNPLTSCSPTTYQGYFWTSIVLPKFRLTANPNNCFLVSFKSNTCVFWGIKLGISLYLQRLNTVYFYRIFCCWNFFGLFLLFPLIKEHWSLENKLLEIFCKSETSRDIKKS